MIDGYINNTFTLFYNYIFFVFFNLLNLKNVNNLLTEVWLKHIQ